MKVVKSLFSVLIILFLSSAVFAQASPKDQAKKMVTKLNSMILQGDAEAGLSDEQKAKITNLHIEHIKTIEAYKKTGATKEEVKAKSSSLRKEINKKISKEILTEQQVAANKIAKKAKKEAKGAKGKKDTPKNKPAKATKGKGKKGKDKAAKSVTKMNNQIKSVDAALALSEDQIEKIKVLYNEKFAGIAKLKEAGAEKAEVSTFNKATMKKILSVLTPEQQKARKKAIKEAKAKKKQK
jgi:hypothetical protein